MLTDEVHLKRKGYGLQVFAGVVLVQVWALTLWGNVLSSTTRAASEADFAEFYLSAAAASEGHYEVLTSRPAMEAERKARLPAARITHPPLYGPHVAFLLQPLAWLPYPVAFTVWAFISVLGAALLVRLISGGDVLALKCWALLSGPLLYVVIVGQLSVLGLAAFAILLQGFRKNSWLIAGLGLGLLVYKPSLLIPAVCVTLLSGQARTTAVAGILGFGAVAVSAAFTGWETIGAYFGNMLLYAREPSLLAARPHLMVSLRSFWNSFLPVTLANVLSVISSAVVVWVAARRIRNTQDPLHRAGLLTISVVLAAPHLYMYDMVILAPAVAAAIRLPAPAPWLRSTTLAVALSPLLVPVVGVLRLQLIAACLVTWFISFARSLRLDEDHKCRRRTLPASETSAS